MKKSLWLGMISPQLFIFLFPVNAQQGMKPFEHLGVGLEVGTLGPVWISPFPFTPT
ncbi:MAG: hypothetical protein LIP04_00815 [Tannerellaceae bacterium]|nr:hypothetical protein [Tannerellaceae bacterium]